MPLLSPQQVELLGCGETANFRASGICDAVRRDFTDQPFHAVDCRNPKEIDDAFRVTRTQKTGGYTLDVAIADGAEIFGNDEIVERAMGIVHSDYGSKTINLLYPDHVIRQLELSDGEHNALVVRLKFDSDGIAEDIPEVCPGRVRVVTWRMGQFAAEFVRKNPDSSYVRLFSSLIGGENPEGFAPLSAGGDIPNSTFSFKLVTESMIQTNLALASFCTQEDIPIPFRNFDEDVFDREAKAQYYHVPVGHNGIPGRGRVDSYTTGTSPLRRLADTIVHFQLGHAISGAEIPYDASEIEVLAGSLN